MAAGGRELDQLVTDLLGRRPEGRYGVAVSTADGRPVVLVNEPFLDSGRPMPTRYWLIDPGLNKALGTLESVGGVKRAEAAVDPQELEAAHDRYRRERELQIERGHDGPRPSGGVGGTRTGVKCLHAHYGYFLAGGDDPVGRWVHRHLEATGDTVDGLVVHHHALTDEELRSIDAAAQDESGETGGSGVAPDMLLVELGSGAVKALWTADGRVHRRRFTTELLVELGGEGVLSSDGDAALRGALTELAPLVGPDTEVTVVATDALRRRPSTDVTDLVRSALGADVDVLDGAREAELGYRAVVGADPVGAGSVPPVTIDIGYGSTELATIGAGGEPIVMTLPIGAAIVCENYLESDPPAAAELSAALSVIELHLDDVRRERPELVRTLASDQAEVIGLGAVRFVAEVELGRDDGDEIDGYELLYPAAEEVFRALATESATDRAANPGLKAEHVDWIVGAMCIVVEMMRQFAIERIRVSTAGVLDGLMFEREFADGAGPSASRQ
jgi:hypothetical protein